MAAGDASRTWFSEMVETLRREWKPDTLWEEIIALRDRLDAMLQQIRLSRGIRPPTKERGQIRSWLFRVASGKGRFRKRRGKEDADLS